MARWRHQSVICCIVVIVFGTMLQGGSTDEIGHYTNDFVVEIDGDLAVADLVASTTGFSVEKQLTSVGDGVFHFIHGGVSARSKRSADDLLARLLANPSVRRVEQQRELTRVKREIIHDKQLELPIRTYSDKSVYQRFKAPKVVRKDEIPNSKDGQNHLKFNDQYFSDQWYLVNTGQSGGPVGYDLNVESAWRKGFTGKGVVVTILDDGIDHTHPDLALNYDPLASGDLNDKDDLLNDPTPDKSKPTNAHGTRCAGEVAAIANNSNCCVGVAYEAKIGGVRMLDGKVTDMLEAQALLYHNQHIDIYSASWGPKDDGKTMEAPGTYVTLALNKAVNEGRKGKGSIFVWATGNGGENGDDCSADGYVSSIHSISIGSISDHGLSTYFSEVCPSTMAVVFTGGSHVPPYNDNYQSPRLKVVTTDLDGKCTLGFEGTSSAAPLAAGCFALVLQANPDLTWRDMQHIVVETSVIPNALEAGWVKNGAGHHVHHSFGFGAIDCSRMVEEAQNWHAVPKQHICVEQAKNSQERFFEGHSAIQTLTVGGCRGDPADVIDRLEHVQLHLEVSHPYRGDVTISLTSPHSTFSEILKPRPNDDYDKGINFTFMTVHNWGEDPRGVWTINVTDVAPQNHCGNRGVLQTWSLTLYGTAASNDVSRDERVNVDSDASPGRDVAQDLNRHQMKKVMDVEEKSSDNVQIARDNNVDDKPSLKKYSLSAYKRDKIGLDSRDNLRLNILAQLLAGDKRAPQENVKRENAPHNNDQRASSDRVNELRAKVDTIGSSFRDNVKRGKLDETDGKILADRDESETEMIDVINAIRKTLQNMKMKKLN